MLCERANDLQAGDVNEVMRLYLDEQISLAKASEMLGLSRYELMEHFERLGIPLRLGPETLEDAQEEIASAQYSQNRSRMTEAVVDNTLLSNFAHIQQPKLLAAAFDQPVTVRAVMDELEVGVQTTRIPSVDWSWLPVIELTDDERVMAEHLNQTLGRGEAACIALAKSRQWIS